MSPRIGVIGGGLAGIAAALSAADAGAQVVLLERRAQLGGLTSSIERGGLSFDNGQHVFMRCCTAYREFLDRIGAADQVYLQSRLDVTVLAPNARSASIRRTALPAPLHLAGLLATYHHLSLRERAHLIAPMAALRRLDPDDPTLDTVAFGDWLAGHGQTSRVVERLWNLIVQPTINVPASQASLALAVKVFRVGLLDHSDGADMGWARVPLSELHGVNAQRSLHEAGVEMLLSSSASSIERSSDGSFLITLAERSVAVDSVIVATSPRVAAVLGVISGPGVAEPLGTSPIVNIHLVLDRRVTDLPFAACVDSPIEFLFDRSESSGVKTGQVLAISLSAAEQYIAQPSGDLVKQFFEALCDLFPGARTARVVDALVTRERAATFRAVPGVATLRSGTATSVPGLFLAGAWCDTGWPATMEGAVRSGREATAQAMGLTTTSHVKDRNNFERLKS